MTSLTFYGGVNEIGGNKILLEEKGTRILLDFGQSFDFGAEYFRSWLSPFSLSDSARYTMLAISMLFVNSLNLLAPNVAKGRMNLFFLDSFLPWRCITVFFQF